MTKFDTAMNDPNPSDRDLIRMYRAFSQGMWRTGWMSDPASVGDEFVNWLRDDYAEYRSRTEEWEFLDFEVAALPVLSRLYTEVFGDEDPVDRTEGVVGLKPTPDHRRVETPEAMTIEVTDDTLTAALSDGRTMSVPLSWYPRLVHATPDKRENCGN